MYTMYYIFVLKIISLMTRGDNVTNTNTNNRLPNKEKITTSPLSETGVTLFLLFCTLGVVI